MERYRDNDLGMKYKLALFFRVKASKLIIKLLFFVVFITALQEPINVKAALLTISVRSNRSSIVACGNSAVPISSDAVAINSGISVIADVNAAGTIMRGASGKLTARGGYFTLSSSNTAKNIPAFATKRLIGVAISDLSGKTVYTGAFTVNAGNDSNLKLHPEHKLSKGMYVVTLVINGQEMSKKLVVE